ncbi:MAG: substrate-binding domain-containing protein [Chloroflexota bacterium]
MYLPGRILLTVALALAGCASPTIPATTPTTNTSELQLLATTATAGLLQELTREYQLVRGGLVLNTAQDNYAGLANRLRQGDGPVYFLSTHVPADSDMWAAPIAYDSIAIIVNTANPVESVSLEQIRAIYRGRLSNWAALGGQDLPVTVFSREDGAGTRIEFENLLMGNRETLQAALVTPSNAAMLERVGEEAAGIGYVSGSMLPATVRPLAVEGVLPAGGNLADRTYPLRTTVFVVGSGEPEGEFRMFISWIQSPAGQAVVARRYAPLLPRPQLDGNEEGSEDDEE